MESLKKRWVWLTKQVKWALEIATISVKNISASKYCPRKDLVQTKVTCKVHWVYNLDECVVWHTCFCETNVSN